MMCKNCGAELPSGNNVCPKCGQPVFAARTFLPKAQAGLVSKAVVAGGLFAAVLLLLVYLTMGDDLSSEEQWIVLACLAVCAAAAASGLLNLFHASKNQLVVGENAVSGRASVGVQSVSFAYPYEEITEVNYVLGNVVIRANGRNLAVAGIENGEKAVEMIRQRLTKS